MDPINAGLDKRSGHKLVLIIAGPNGAGKTAFATQFLPNEGNCPTFINADLIAAGLNPFRPERGCLGSWTDDAEGDGQVCRAGGELCI